jgi:hypothetical protein
VEVVEPEASFQRAHRCFGVVLGGAIDTCVCCGEATIYVRLRYYMRRGGELVVGEALRAGLCAEPERAEDQSVDPVAPQPSVRALFFCYPPLTARGCSCCLRDRENV